MADEIEEITAKLQGEAVQQFRIRSRVLEAGKLSKAQIVKDFGLTETAYVRIRDSLRNDPEVEIGPRAVGGLRRRNHAAGSQPVELGEDVVSEVVESLKERLALSKDEILGTWGLSEDGYELLKKRLASTPRIDSGPQGRGGFTYKPKTAPPLQQTQDARLSLTLWQFDAVERLVQLFDYEALEKLVGLLAYSLRVLRKHQTGIDSRGTKRDHAAALVIKHDRDLLADVEIRNAIGKAAGVAAPGRWSPGKAAAVEFTRAVKLPDELAGTPNSAPPDDYVLLEGPPAFAKLEQYQESVSKRMLETLRQSGGRAIVTLPTGAGKTRVAVETLRLWLRELKNEPQTGARQTLVWLAHTEELCEQACSSFEQVWRGSPDSPPTHMFRLWGNHLRDVLGHASVLERAAGSCTVVVSTPQRLNNTLEQPSNETVALLRVLRDHGAAVVVDEAHRAATPTYKAIFGSLERANSSLRIIGLTATPFRKEYAQDATEGTKELQAVFRHLIEPDFGGEDPRWALQKQGVLARPVVMEVMTDTIIETPDADWSDPPTAEDADRIDYAFARRTDKPRRRLAILDAVVAVAREEQTSMLYFGPSVEDAECMAFLLRERSIPAAVVSGSTLPATRRRVIEEFRRGRLKVLCNCEVLTTGFDAPRVSHVVMARPTVSQVLYEQMVGRGLRGPKFGGTAECTIIDVVDRERGIIPKLGYVGFRRVWQPNLMTQPMGRSTDEHWQVSQRS